MSLLRTAPSLSMYNSEDGSAEEGEKDEEVLGRSVTIAESIEVMGSGEFSFRKKSMSSIEEDGEQEGEGSNEFQDLGIEEVEPVSQPPMYLATGLGIVDGGSCFTPSCFDEDADVEEYYKRMVGEDPSNPLFLRNYAQLLQSNGDLHGAEEYFFRAALADPKDGEILLSYAKLVWELHRDQDRALIYFEQAARAVPEDSHVQAAYACFLWEINEDKEEDCAQNDHTQIEEDGLAEVKEKETVSSPLHLAARPGIGVVAVGGIDGVDFSAANSRKGVSIEEYYKRMVEENPFHPLFLRNYAQFLYQSKGDLPGAEEYYSRAVLADPANGEIISQYANLVWELHRDHHKALSYFERAIRATPEDSHVLAAYANFLWETEDDDREEDGDGQDQEQALISLGAMTYTNA